MSSLMATSSEVSS